MNVPRDARPRLARGNSIESGAQLLLVAGLLGPLRERRYASDVRSCAQGPHESTA